jgi:putative flippase GtrA
MNEDSLEVSGRRRETAGTWAAGQSPARAMARAQAFVVEFIATPGRLLQFLRYLGVSVLALSVDLAAFWVLMQAGALSPVAAGASSVLAGLVVHYTLSAFFVFADQDTGKTQARLISEYAMTGLAGVLITAGVMFVAVEFAGLPAMLAKGGAVGVTFVAVYVMRASLVFQPNDRVEPALGAAGPQGGGN